MCQHLRDGSQTSQLPGLLFFQSGNGFLYGCQRHPFGFRRTLCPMLRQFPTDPFHFCPPARQVVVQLLQSTACHIHFLHFQSGQFLQILTGNLRMTDKKSFHSGAFFLPQLLRCLYGMADRKHGSVQRVPLSRKAFRTRPVGYRLCRLLLPSRKFRQDSLTDRLHLLHLRSQRLYPVRKLLSPRLLFHIPIGFFLQGGNKVLPIGLPSFLPRRKDNQGLSFLHALGNGQCLTRKRLFQHTQFGFQTGHGFIGFLYLPVPLLAGSGQFLPFLRQTVQALLSFLGLFPQRFQPAAYLLLRRQGLLYLRYYLIRFFHHSIKRHICHGLFRQRISFFCRSFLLRLHFFQPHQGANLRFRPCKCSQDFFRPTCLFFQQCTYRFQQRHKMGLILQVITCLLAADWTHIAF